MLLDVLKSLANNPELLQAVKEEVLSRFSETPYAEGASDELLGQLTRARISGIKKVEDAFRAIESLKTVPQSPDKENPAY